MGAFFIFYRGFFMACISGGSGSFVLLVGVTMGGVSLNPELVLGTFFLFISIGSLGVLNWLPIVDLRAFNDVDIFFLELTKLGRIWGSGACPMSSERAALISVSASSNFIYSIPSTT